MPLTMGRAAPLDYVLTERATAEMLGVSVRTLRRSVALGEGPARVRLSARRIGYRVKDITAFLDRHTDANPRTDAAVPEETIA